jgi:L-ribulokinase
MGAIGAEIEPYAFVRIIGTSTCDILMAPNEEIGHRLIRGICGQVDGSVAPGMLGLEAGSVGIWGRLRLVRAIDSQSST